MTDSKSRQILAKLFTLMGTINTANGYRTAAVDRVTYEFLTPDQINEKVTICVVAGDTPYTRLTSNKYTTGQGLQTLDGFRVSLILYLKSIQDTTKTGLAVLELEDLAADVIECLGKSDWSALPFYGLHMLVGSFRYPSIAQGVHAHQLVIEVKYDFDDTAA